MRQSFLVVAAALTVTSTAAAQNASWPVAEASARGTFPDDAPSAPPPRPAAPASPPAAPTPTPATTVPGAPLAPSPATTVPLAPSAPPTWPAWTPAPAPMQPPAPVPPAAGSEAPFSIGPVLGLGLPSLTSFTLAARFGRYAGAGLTYGVIPTVRISYYGQAALSYQEFEGNVSLYPFGGAFFVGSGFGYATARGTLSKTFDLSAYAPLVSGLPTSLDYTSDASVSAIVVTPRIGFLQRFGSGFTIGADLGAQIPLSTTDVSFTSHLPAGVPNEVKTTYVDPNDAKVQSTIRKAARTPIPTFGFRVGWMF